MVEGTYKDEIRFALITSSSKEDNQVMEMAFNKV
jgi:hypothetical protein